MGIYQPAYAYSTNSLHSVIMESKRTRTQPLVLHESKGAHYHGYFYSSLVASCIFLAAPRQTCFVKGEETICQRIYKGAVAKRDSSPMSVSYARLPTCTMRMGTLRKPSQKWS